jgi:hypothetical protein
MHMLDRSSALREKRDRVFNVMAGLGPAIHVFTRIRNDLDAGPAAGTMM